MADDPVWVRKLNRWRVNLRQPFADLANALAGTREDGSHFEVRNLHALTSKNLTKQFGRVLPPHLAGAAADVLGYANEAVPGALQVLAGNSFVGPAGWDPEDVKENWRGQREAMRELGYEGDSDADDEGRGLALEALGLGSYRPKAAPMVGLEARRSGLKRAVAR